MYTTKRISITSTKTTRRTGVWSAFAANKCPRKKQSSVTVLSGRDDLKVQFQPAAARDTRDIVARIPAIIYLKYTVWPFVAFLQTQPRQSWIREHQRGGYRLLVVLLHPQHHRTTPPPPRCYPCVRFHGCILIFTLPDFDTLHIYILHFLTVTF